MLDSSMYVYIYYMMYMIYVYMHDMLHLHAVGQIYDLTDARFVWMVRMISNIHKYCQVKLISAKAKTTHRGEEAARERGHWG